MPYVEDAIGLNEWAERYREEHKHCPLIIGRAYRIMEQPCTLVEADDYGGDTCLIQGPFGSPARVQIGELEWQKQVKWREPDSSDKE